MATTNLDSADLKAAQAGGLIREDVMNKIWDISKIPLPFTDMISEGSASQEYTEWTEDTLSAPDLANAVIDGADINQNDSVLGTRQGNHCQTSVKMVQVSTRADGSDVIGQSKALSHQVMRRQQELRRDVEAISLSGQGSVADNGNNVAGKVGGLAAWIKTNASRGVGGTGSGFNFGTKLVTSVVDGTKRPLSESAIKDAVENVYNEGGNSSTLMTVPGLCRKFSEYLFTASARVATLQSDQGKSSEAATALGAVNVFVTDFGTLALMPNRLQQKTGASDAADVFILDADYIECAKLKGYTTEPLAKTGLSEKRLMSVDWTIKVLNEKAQAIIADIDVSADVITG